ncbi:MAG: DUF6515 family protein [Burkholderiales bacterium]
MSDINTVGAIHRPGLRHAVVGAAALLGLLAAAPGTAWAERGGHDQDGRFDRRGGQVVGQSRGPMGQAMERAVGGPPSRPSPPPANLPRGRWWDGAYGHSHDYPVPGYRYRALPPSAHAVYWGGARYAYGGGVWYTPSPYGYVVVRPPYGVVIGDLPAFATLLTIGAASYWYANGAYYRQAPGGYEVVSPPVEAQVVDGNGNAPDRVYIYPRLGQSADKQASDEYECHRWAVGQSGFDPTAEATGSSSDISRRRDYTRAQAACLDGRGYTVK